MSLEQMESPEIIDDTSDAPRQENPDHDTFVAYAGQVNDFDQALQGGKIEDAVDHFAVLKETIGNIKVGNIIAEKLTPEQRALLRIINNEADFIMKLRAKLELQMKSERSSTEDFGALAA